MFVYLSQGGRDIHQIYSSGELIFPVIGNENIFTEACECKPESDNTLGYVCPDSEGDRGLQIFQQAVSRNDAIDGEGEGSSSERKRPNYDRQYVLGEKASEKILEWLPLTIHAFIHDPRFKKEFPQMYWNKRMRESILDIAWKDACNKLMDKTFKQIADERFKQIDAYINYSRPYYAPFYSAQLIGRVIKEQCLDNADCIAFIDRLIDVVDKQVGKYNTFYILGKPGCGKGFIMDSVLELFAPSSGKIRNPKKGGDTFCFQDGVHCRINEWNECVLDGKDFIETAKEVWEGKPTPVNVKHEKKIILDRTPLIVCCNGIPWRHHPMEREAFQQRCFEFHWQQQPWLKQVAMYPVPVAWYYILNDYKKDEFWDSLWEIDAFLDADKQKIIMDPENVYLDLYCKSDTSISDIINYIEHKNDVIN